MGPLSSNEEDWLLCDASCLLVPAPLRVAIGNFLPKIFRGTVKLMPTALAGKEVTATMIFDDDVQRHLKTR